MGETWCSCLSQWTEGLPDRQALSSPCPCQIFQKEHKSSEGGEGKRERVREREGEREREREGVINIRLTSKTSQFLYHIL